MVKPTESERGCGFAVHLFTSEIRDAFSFSILPSTGKLRSQLCELKLTLTQEQKAILQEPSLLRGYQAIHPALEQYIVLRHYVAKYELQLHAYGPFRTTRDEKEVLLDNRRMERDFSSQRHGSFQNFLKQVRFYLWMMEDDMIERRAVSACCDEEL